jgi:hypothetical protein
MVALPPKLPPNYLGLGGNTSAFASCGYACRIGLGSIVSQADISGPGWQARWGRVSWAVVEQHIDCRRCFLLN